MSAPNWAVPGQKVVCVSSSQGKWEARGWLHKYVVDGPQKDEVCTVIRARFDSHDGWLIVLREYAIIVRGRRDGYTVGDFRPLVEHKREAKDRVTFDEWLKTPEPTQ